MSNIYIYIRQYYLRKWFKDPSYNGEGFRDVVDWEYYKERLGQYIYKYIYIYICLCTMYMMCIVFIHLYTVLMSILHSLCMY